MEHCPDHPDIRKMEKYGSLNPREPLYICECGCDEEMYPGEVQYDWDGSWICEEHFADKVLDLLRDDPEYLAEMMGIETHRLPEEGGF